MGIILEFIWACFKFLIKVLWIAILVAIGVIIALIVLGIVYIPWLPLPWR